jgi:hypothetical protein
VRLLEIDPQTLKIWARHGLVTAHQYETFGTFAVNGSVPGDPVQRFLTLAPPINVLVGLKYTF